MTESYLRGSKAVFMYYISVATIATPLCSLFNLFNGSQCLQIVFEKSNRKAMNRNWNNQKANRALKAKTGNK